MWLENRIFREDMESVARRSEIAWDRLSGRTILITGATGLIGYTTLCALLYGTRLFESPPHVVALVRSMDKAEAQMESLLKDFPDRLSLLTGNVLSPPEIPGSVDYIIHGACPTASRHFVEYPVETIRTAVRGTENMLELARIKHSLGFVYLSSMEVYGRGKAEGSIEEDFPGDVDPLSVRNCYPESKRMCENICICYQKEYSVPVRIARLAQTFGPGVAADDVRVFAEFSRRALAGQDIVLVTDGLSERMCLYTADAAAAILCLLLNEQAEGAYNIANESTFCSIRETASVVIETLGNGSCRLHLPDEVDQEKAARYPPRYRLYLDTGRLKALGWEATCNLANMFRRMVESTWIT